MNTLRNHVQLIGNVGAEPEIKNTVNGKTFAKISLATNRVFRGENGEKKTQTNWHNLIVWGKQSSIVERFVTKGTEIAVNGTINSTIYLDQKGNSRQKTEIVVRDMKIMTRKK